MKFLKSAVLALLISVAAPSVAEARCIRTDDIDVLSSYCPLGPVSWIMIAPGGRVFNSEAEVAAVAEYPWMVTATTSYLFQDGSKAVEIEYTLPGSLTTYSGLVWEEDVQDFFFNQSY